MSDIGEMLTKAVEGVTRQFNAQVEASIAMLVNSGIPLDRIELINRTADDLGVVTEVRSRTSDEAQARKEEREAIAGWLDECAESAEFYGPKNHDDCARKEAASVARNLRGAANGIRSGEHNQDQS